MAKGAVALSVARAEEYLGGNPITEKTMGALVLWNEIAFAEIGRTVFLITALKECIKQTTV